MRIIGRLVVIGFAAGCGNKSASNDGELKIVVADTKERLTKIRTAITSPNPESGVPECSNMIVFDQIKQGDSKLADDYKRACLLDLPMAVTKYYVETIEVARKAKPNEKVLPECMKTIDVRVADIRKDTGQLGSADEAALKDYEKRFAVACPSL